MRIRIILVGKVREKYLRDGVAEYLKRLGPYAHVELVELQDEPVPETSSDKQLAAARQLEAERVLRTLGTMSMWLPWTSGARRCPLKTSVGGFRNVRWPVIPTWLSLSVGPQD